jgi:hypothetical protein
VYHFENTLKILDCKIEKGDIVHKLYSIRLILKTIAAALFKSVGTGAGNVACVGPWV